MPRSKAKPVPLEAHEESASRRLFDRLGFCVFSLSQYRATAQTEGLSDTYAVHPGVGVAVWLESKRTKRFQVSPMQREFEAVHAAARAVHPVDQQVMGVKCDAGVPAVVIGSLADAERFAIECGLAVRLGSGMLLEKPNRTPVYFRWKETLRAERNRRALARRIRKAKQLARR